MRLHNFAWRFILLVLTAVPWAPQPCRAQVRVRKAADVAAPIDLSGLTVADEPAAHLFRQTLAANLERFGWFIPAPPGAGTFRVLGTVAVSGAAVSVRLELVRPATRETLLRRTYGGDLAQSRRLAHGAHDDIVAAATGRRGIASTTILLIGARGGAKEIYLVDADGENLRQITRDRSISVAPAWAPDGRRFAYTSFVGGFPDIYMVDMENQHRERIVSFPGLNSSAAFSPDGRELAFILSKDGNPELYVRNLHSGRLTRLTRTRHANEASPSWSPDGKRIVYVSDSTGNPHLYLVDRTGQGFRRLTTRGRDNSSPDWGPDGRIIYSSRHGGHTQLAVIDPDSERGDGQTVTNEPVNHEDPSWAPDGRHVVYTRSAAGRSAVYVLDTMTGFSLPLFRMEGEWYSPVWSP